MRARLFGIVCVLALASVWTLPHVEANTGGNRWQDYSTAFAEAERAFAQRKFNAAVLGYQAALGLKPQEVRPRFRLGQTLLALGSFAEAGQQFQALLADYPNHINARLLFARCLVGMGQKDEAKQHLSWILQVQPEHAEAQQVLASIAAGGTTMAKAGAMPAARSSDDADAGWQSLESKRSTSQAAAGPVGSGELQQAVLISSGQSTGPKGFQPLRNGAGTTTNPAKEARPAPPIPPAAERVSGWKVGDFLGMASSSFSVRVEYAKYCLERDDLARAAAELDAAEGLSIEMKDTRRFLEVQIFKSLTSLYNADIRSFGQGLIKIKPLLSKETYLSFLDIYNRANVATTAVDVARLVGGVAMGAEHFQVAVRILKEVVVNQPGDDLALGMLAQAQLESRDWAGAEKSFLRAAKLDPRNPEPAFNLARFYLTVRNDPARARIYAGQVGSVNPNDPRLPVLLALLDYAEGRVAEGMARLQNQLNSVTDQGLVRVIRRVLLEGGSIKDGEVSSARFAKLLALPGAGGQEGLTRLGEEYLRRGSFFHALKVANEAKDLAEVGRAYLALASHLFSAGDGKAAAWAAGFGLNSLGEALRRSPGSARAHLYQALYHFERRDLEAAKQAVQSGLKCGPELETRRHLTALQQQLG